MIPQPHTTKGLFLRGGALFMLILFPAILSFADVQSAFVGRNVLAKHKSYSMYAPAAIIWAQTLLDAPIFLVQMIIYVTVTYWLCHLQSNGGLYWAAICFAFFVTNTITALFRSIGYSFGNYNDASKVSGTLFTIFVLYSGYIIVSQTLESKS
jgi:ABC-type multidrug transport system permease subunit